MSCRAAWLTGAAALATALSAGGPAAQADTVAYLVNVTVRPGYGFDSADTALSYGHAICNAVSAGRTYAQLIDDVKADFNTSYDYQGSYLITQSVNELCPALIWHLRNSAAGHRPAT